MHPTQNESDPLDVPLADVSDEGPSTMSQDTKDELIVPDVMEVPDGGSKAWLTVMGACVAPARSAVALGHNKLVPQVVRPVQHIWVRPLWLRSRFFVTNPI